MGNPWLNDDNESLGFLPGNLNEKITVDWGLPPVFRFHTQLAGLPDSDTVKIDNVEICLKEFYTDVLNEVNKKIQETVDEVNKRLQETSDCYDEHLL